MFDSKPATSIPPEHARRTTGLVKALDAQLQSLTGDYTTLAKVNVAQKNTIFNWRAEARALRAQLIREQVRHAAVQKTQARLEGRIEELESLVRSQEETLVDRDACEEEDTNLAYLQRQSSSTFIFGSCKARRVAQLMRTQRVQRTQIAERDDEIMRLMLHRAAMNAELTAVTAGLKALQKVAVKQHDKLRLQTAELDSASTEFGMMKFSADVYRMDAEYWKAEAIKARGMVARAQGPLEEDGKVGDVRDAAPTARVVLYEAS
ncbi:hypothetical protein PENSPDRAFT_759480 [Peniophora sp. CONT]|nr:hypothetical protein PENSPDRAFT_759480 [Peniophora sp. CONT]